MKKFYRPVPVRTFQRSAEQMMDNAALKELVLKNF
jgi:hypothetical protein